MATGKTLTVAIMDAPYESASSTTALRIINAALEKGHNVNVFAYEGAVSLTMKGQQPHPNPVKGTSVEQEQHPTTKDWVASLFKLAGQRGVSSIGSTAACASMSGAREIGLRAQGAAALKISWMRPLQAMPRS